MPVHNDFNTSFAGSTIMPDPLSLSIYFFNIFLEWTQGKLENYKIELKTMTDKFNKTATNSFNTSLER